jgi:hypothetical protein
MKFMNYFLKISLASLLAVTMMTPSNAMSADPGIPQTYYPMMTQPMMSIPMHFQLQLGVDAKPVQVTVDPHTIELAATSINSTLKLAAMSGLLLLGVYGICKLLGAQNGPQYGAAGATAAVVAAGICCLKYSDTILGQ